jgi:hypothetical protein
MNMFMNMRILRNHLSAEEWADVLSPSEHVKTIEFYLCHAESAETRNVDSLLRIIATRDILEEVKLFGPTRRPELIDRFLLSIQLNPAIHTVRLFYVEVSGTALAGFLDAATSVTTFELHDCSMDAAEREQGVIDLAASMQRNTRVRKLSLCYLDDVYLCPILSGLATNSHVKELEFRRDDPSREASEAVKRLLESTATIDSFILTSLIGSEDNFHPIAQGLINSESVTDVCFDECNFRGDGSTRLLKGILQSKPNIRSLYVRLCPISRGEMSADNIINLLQTDASFRSLELIRVNLRHFGFPSSVEFKALLEAVGTRELERFSIGRIVEQTLCQEFISSIPKMQVRTLQFTLADDMERFKPSILYALKTNASIYNVVGEMDEGYDDDDEEDDDDDDEIEDYFFTNLFNEEDKRKLNYYAARNKGLSQWIASSPSVPKEAWPRALAAARVTGPGTMYRILKVLSNSVGPVEGMRKRKHPIRYTPPL